MQPRRMSQTNPKIGITLSPQSQKVMLLQQIKRQRQLAAKLDLQLVQKKKDHQKAIQSNQRNMKRILRVRAKMQEMYKYRNKPQYFLQVSGFMNQYVQSFILSHNYQFQAVETSDPDNMSYQQLIALGQKIGKVSKGISKQAFQSLKRIPYNSSLKQALCSVCQCQYEKGQQIISLLCKHSYHQQCIQEWLKDQNTCPMCKQHVLGK